MYFCIRGPNFENEFITPILECQQRFISFRLIYNLEPTILLERPASPTRNKYDNDADVSSSVPNYMTGKYI